MAYTILLVLKVPQLNDQGSNQQDPTLTLSPFFRTVAKLSHFIGSTSHQGPKGSRSGFAHVENSAVVPSSYLQRGMVSGFAQARELARCAAAAFAVKT
jgi:hypothetical protein